MSPTWQVDSLPQNKNQLFLLLSFHSCPMTHISFPNITLHSLLNSCKKKKNFTNDVII